MEGLQALRIMSEFIGSLGVRVWSFPVGEVELQRLI
jgi:hypothetical protein